MIIFDEVHRLLPKFGGSGQGFLQIERGMREFRKLGIGLMLISQVLTDFIGQTKANIANEIQMRTRDQGDLGRIKDKYGTGMLQSLLKASTGTGMFENPAYNNGNPYFISFRPLFHEHARLSDEELDSYNKYNDIVDDVDFEIDQLKELGQDVFDLKLELKMALDKVKSGNFNMVDVYMEGLMPRVEEVWKKINKKPQKREMKLVDESELQKEFEKAKKEREAASDKEGADILDQKVKEEKHYEPLKLLDGHTVHNPTELIDVINTWEEEEFAKHITSEKNVFADWIRQTSDEVADALLKVADKDNIIAILEDNRDKL